MDLIFIFSIFILGIIGFFRGFFKEILGLISFIASLCLSITLNNIIVKKTLFMIDEPIIASTIAYVLSFLLILFILMLFNLFIIKIFNLNNDSIFTKILGGSVGIFKSYLFCLLIYFIIYSFALITNDNPEEESNIQKMHRVMPRFFKESRTYPFFLGSIDKIDKLFKVLYFKKSVDSKKENNGLNNKTEDHKNEKDSKNLENNNEMKENNQSLEKNNNEINEIKENLEKNNNEMKENNQSLEKNNNEINEIKEGSETKTIDNFEKNSNSV